jgi:hypothetical protein
MGRDVGWWVPSVTEDGNRGKNCNRDNSHCKNFRHIASPLAGCPPGRNGFFKAAATAFGGFPCLKRHAILTQETEPQLNSS